MSIHTQLYTFKTDDNERLPLPAAPSRDFSMNTRGKKLSPLPFAERGVKRPVHRL
jgi:hypothetical protein